jgi:hypothetical protein
MKAAREINMISSLLWLCCGTVFAETASELRQSSQYQDHMRALALLDQVSNEIRSCVGRSTWGHMLTEAEVKSRIPECKNIRDDYLLKQAIRNWLPVFTAVISLALIIGFYRRIAAKFYNLFVRILSFGIRVKRFIDHAMKDATDRNQ